MSVDTTNWNKTTVTVDGVDFVSLVNPDSAMAKQIAMVPSEMYVSMVKGAIADCIGSVATMTRDEIVKQLEVVNVGFSEAYIALA